MAINDINIGSIANDGTGDDLRTAFDKINNNFTELDTRFPKETTGINLGNIGEGIFVSADQGELSFKKIVAGSNISIASAANNITISSTGGLDSLLIVSDSGSITVERGQSLSISGTDGIQTRTIGQNLIVEATDGVLAADGDPTLSATLNANNNNIIDAGTVTATQFNGPLEGLVYGVDVRTIAGFYNDFDFGEIIVPNYTSIIEWLQREVDVDFGTYVAPGLVFGTVDGGTFA